MADRKPLYRKCWISLRHSFSNTTDHSDSTGVRLTENMLLPIFWSTGPKLWAVVSSSSTAKSREVLRFLETAPNTGNTKQLLAHRAKGKEAGDNHPLLICPHWRQIKSTVDATAWNDDNYVPMEHDFQEA